MLYTNSVVYSSLQKHIYTASPAPPQSRPAWRICNGTSKYFSNRRRLQQMTDWLREREWPKVIVSPILIN